jgi:hypothetical protein
MSGRRRVGMEAIPAWLALVLAGSCSSAGSEPGAGDGAIVTFAFQGRTDTMLVLITDRVTIAQAETRVRTGRGAAIPIGPIVRGAGVDPRFPFHFLPDSVRLAEVAIELCDGRPMRTAAEVDDFFEGSTGHRDAPRATWCPWGAYPIAVRH